MTHHDFLSPIFSITTNPDLKTSCQIIYWFKSFDNIKWTLGKWVNYVKGVELSGGGSVTKKSTEELFQYIL